MDAEQDLYNKLLLAERIAPTATTVGSAMGVPDESKPVTLRNLFKHPDSHPVVLDFALTKQFGSDWFGWEAETIWDEVKDEFGLTFSEVVQNKVRALQAIHSTRLPWHSWPVFEKVATAFNGTLPDFKVTQMLSLEELYAAVDTLDFLRKERYDPEVKLYMAATVLHDDVFYVPPPLDFIQDEVSQPFLHCQDCGNEEPLLFSDGYCSNCTQRMHPLQMLTMAPKGDLIDQGKGKNWTPGVRYDPAPTKKVWDEQRDKSYAFFKTEFAAHEDDPAWVQVNQLMVARDYMNLRRQQLTEQLTALRPWLGSA